MKSEMQRKNLRENGKYNIKEDSKEKHKGNRYKGTAKKNIKGRDP